MGKAPDTERQEHLSASCPPLSLPRSLPLEGRSVNTLTGEISPGDPVPPLGLSNAHIGKQPTLTVAFEGRLFVLRNPSAEGRSIPPGERGDIVEFSRQSRKRLMQLFASIDESAVRSTAVFLTLTYHLDWPDSPGGCRAQLRLFLKAFQFKFPQTAQIWRLEFQQRGAPHYHILAVGVSFVDKDWVTATWGRIAHGTSIYHGLMATNTVQIDNWYHACAYVSKEIAKVKQQSWGEKVGRYWGVEGRQYLPIHVDDITLTKSQFSRLKELLLSRMPARSINKWIAHGPNGCWSMVPGSESLRMLAWAISQDGPASQYVREPIE